MLGPKELKTLHELFLTRVSLGEFEGLLRDLGKTAAREKTYEEVLSYDLDRANRHAWLPNLVDETSHANEGFAEDFDAAVREYPALSTVRRPPAAATKGDGVSIFDVCYFKRRPFVDRRRLRRLLPLLHRMDDETVRILLVQGEPYSGKSYTADFIQHLSVHLGFRVRRVELLKHATGRELTPEILGRAIVDEMKLAEAMPPVERDQVAWWTTYYLSWLARNLRDTGDTWWIVIDDFAQVNVPRAVYEFIEVLALELDRSLDSIRLVLVGFDRDLPEKLVPILKVDRTEPITETHLVDYFAQFLHDHVPAVDAGEAPRVIAEAVRSVRDEMSKREPRNRLVGMMATIVREIDRLRGEA
jgi:hypothetical protein